MKAVIVTTSDIAGGASRASYTLSKGLSAIGIDAQVITLNKFSKDPKVHKAAVPRYTLCDRWRKFFHDLLIAYFRSARTNLSNTLFSLPYPGVDISQLAVIREADIINLHWVAGFQSPVTIRRILALNKPVVWTLHDQFAYSGGCHYAGGCLGFTRDCQTCPQLQKDFGVPRAIIQDKIEIYRGTNLTIAAPSSWVRDAIKGSSVFKNHHVSVIPYSIDHRQFQPQSKAKARQKLNMPAGAFTILFGSDNGDEKRKGFDFLFDALKICYLNKKFLEASEAGLITLLTMGEPNTRLLASGWPVRSAGRISSDEDLNIFYSAGDIIVIPSLEDTLPLTMLEAMSSGTPSVTFNSRNGGMRDVVRHNQDGVLVRTGDSEALAEALLSLHGSPRTLRKLQRNCRKTIERHYYFTREARDYARLFKQILNKQHSLPDTITPGLFGIFFAKKILPASIQLFLTGKFYKQVGMMIWHRSKFLVRKLRG